MIIPIYSLQLPEGMAVNAPGIVNIINSTITGNIGEQGVFVEGGANLNVTNSIIFGNNGSEIVFKPAGGDSPHSYATINYSNIEGGPDSIVTNNNGTVTWGSGNIDVDPRFVDTDNGDYHLADWSPCIGTGLDTSIVSSTDIEGNLRPSPAGSNPDMGAYENALDAASTYTRHLWYVSTAGFDSVSADMGTITNPFKTIQHA